MSVVRAKFDGLALVPESSADLVPGHIYDVDVREPDTEPPKGSPAAILKLLSELPKVPREDIDELNRAIASGKTPIRFDDDPFANFPEPNE